MDYKGLAHKVDFVLEVVQLTSSYHEGQRHEMKQRRNPTKPVHLITPIFIGWLTERKLRWAHLPPIPMHKAR